MSTLVLAAFIRHCRQHPWQLALAMLGVMVGVAVIVAIRLTQLSAIEAFNDASQTLYGHASHRIDAVDGTIGDHDTQALAAALPELRLTPVVSFDAVVSGSDDHIIQIVGIDPISRLNTVDRRTTDPIYYRPRELISQPDSGFTNAATLHALGLPVGGRIQLEIGETRRSINVIDVVPTAARRGGIPDNILVVDIATALELRAPTGGVDHLSLQISTPTMLSSLTTYLDGNPRLKLIDLNAEALGVEQLTAAFYSNLTALSLMALIVGMFLIYNTETFLILQRRELIAKLRALGVDRHQIFIAVIIEAALIGALASIAGAVVGVALANGLVEIVSTTVNDLYFDASVQEIAFDRTTLLAGVLIGIAATVIAAVVPARDAIATQPRLALAQNVTHRSSRRRLGFIVASLFIFSVTTAALVLTMIESSLAGFASIALVVFGFAWLSPLAILALVTIGQRLVAQRDYMPEKLGLSALARSLDRTGTATAALMVATATSIGIGIMVLSFRASVDHWLDSALRGDLYVAAGNFDNQTSPQKIDPAIAVHVDALPEVDSVTHVVRRRASSNLGDIRITAFALNEQAKNGFIFLSAAADSVWRSWESEGAALVTEPFAHHHNLKLGDTITISEGNDQQALHVIGIYRDYASEQGSIAVHRRTYSRLWPIAGYDGIGIYRRPSTEEEAFEQAVASVLNDIDGISVKSSAELKATSLAIFDRTFLITELLRLIAVVVAFIGILGALLAQQLERTREYGILRALGMSHGNILRVVMTQTMILGVSAALIAVPVGTLVGVILIDVVNPRSFGWTMPMLFPPSLITASCLTALVAAALAGIYPAIRAIRIQPALAMRFE